MKKIIFDNFFVPRSSNPRSETFLASLRYEEKDNDERISMNTLRRNKLKIIIA